MPKFCRLLCILSLSIIMSIWLAACGAGNTPTPGELSVWADRTSARGLNFCAGQFGAAKLKIVEMAQSDIHARLWTNMLAGGVGLPDIAIVESRQMAVFNGKFPNGFYDLNEVAGRYKPDFAASKWVQSEYKNHIRSLPWDVAPAVLFYRADIWAKAGINPAQIETWDDFGAAGARLQAAQPNVKALGGMFSADDLFLRVLLHQQQSFYFSEEANSLITLNKLSTERALGVLQKLHTQNLVLNAANPDELTDAARDGKFAAILAPTDWAATLVNELPQQNGLWGMSSIPALEKNGARIADTGGVTLAIPSKSRNIPTAWAFIENCLATKANQSELARLTYRLPAHLPTLRDFSGFPDTKYFTTPAIWRTLAEQSQTFAPPPYTSYYDKAAAQVVRLQTAILQGVPIQPTLRDAAERLKDESGLELARQP
jgi:lactose/L-arabinose transport system substrate-binding protein